MKKKVMIYAYTNFNLGDDLFIKILCERYPETQFYLYAPSNYKYSLKNMKNITLYPSDKILNRLVNYGIKILKLKSSLRTIIANKSDAIVHIGGSIFMQRGVWTGLKDDRKVKVKKPYYVLGSNFGPYQDEKFHSDHYELFQEYTDICFRDTQSYELFKDLNNVRLADDIVFQLKVQDRITMGEKVVISVIKPSFRKDFEHCDDIYYKKIKDITVSFVERGYTVVLMSFCEREGDKEAIEKITSIIPKEVMPNVQKYYYKHNIEEALDVISSSVFVVATRFHAMILGWVFKKPVYPIAYSKKMNNVMENLNFKGSYINLKEISNLNPLEVYESFERNLLDVSGQAKNSERHFEKLDEFLLYS